MADSFIFVFVFVIWFCLFSAHTSPQLIFGEILQFNLYLSIILSHREMLCLTGTPRVLVYTLSQLDSGQYNHRLICWLLSGNRFIFRRSKW